MLPSLFISHGSPMLALHPEASGPVLARLAARLPRPRAVLVQSAHWESEELLLGSAAQPSTWHDFQGFPPALYGVWGAMEPKTNVSSESHRKGAFRSPAHPPGITGSSHLRV